MFITFSAFFDKNNISSNEAKKEYDVIITENLRTLMKSFNIEKKFSKEIDTNPNENINQNFNNHYSKHLPFIILDIRMFSEKNEKFYDFKPGFLPMSVIVEQEEIKDEFVINKIFNTNK